MTLARLTAAVIPLRRRERAPFVHPSVTAAVIAERPAVPMHCLRPGVLTAEAARFVSGFPGAVLYAVKCNPDPAVIRALARGGVRHFDCASLAEVRLIRRQVPGAAIAFMHPVKPRPAIREAYAIHGVRDFVLDSFAELDKIRAETDGAEDLGLIIRLALPKGNARLDLSGKFGAPPELAAALLRTARLHSRRIGISFHVGSQCLEPAAYARAVALAGKVAATAGVVIDVLDVGGGFPVPYPDQVPPPVEAFFAAIQAAVAVLDHPGGLELWAEPGRALVAAGQSVVVQVLGRRGDDLYLNDGVYGTLADAGALGFRYPCRLIRPGTPAPAAERQAFGFFGPTCDSADRMEGPFLLPADVGEGDWIEIGQIGAYGTALRTGFNGFDASLAVTVADPPLYLVERAAD